jgi:hypothetical protein
MPEMSRQNTAVPKMSRADFFIALDDSGETFAGKLFQNRRLVFGCGDNGMLEMLTGREFQS